ncbi:MAG: cysteine--tRNA ligase [Candidatus Omnitrophica bacterium]|nr:cysteine--tRNA ligase [Candidatus Omnitrophota bacterium]
MIQFYNTLSGRSEPFEPLNPGEVRLYTCGPTVYDYAHIGNFRAFVFEDLLRRFLEYKKYKVEHVMNITDVDDKTIAGANREGKTLSEFTEKYTKAFQDDMKMLNCLPPTKQPRATDEIESMLTLIKSLIQKGIAYESEGSVYYRVSKFQNYGKLSKKNLSMNKEGARVDVDEYDKEEGADFVLWKKSKEGEPSWESPWGKGRPGWHIECSAMSMKYLGESFDLHAGGEDLIFPHHENEIAQSEAVTGKPFVKYWMHCKFLLVNGEKMSKSKGNFYTLRDLLAKGYDPMAIRYALLSIHYQTPLNFTLEGLEEAKGVVELLRNCYSDLLNLQRIDIGYEVEPKKVADHNYDQFLKNTNDELNIIEKALSNNLNVSVALAAIFDEVRNINYGISNKLFMQESLVKALEFFEVLEMIFGLGVTHKKDIPIEVLQCHEHRSSIRKYPNFKTDKDLQKLSDDLRRKIEDLGWSVKDGRPGEPSALKPRI